MKTGACGAVEQGRESGENLEHGCAPLETVQIGIDETEGRFADVTVERCGSCGRVWLRYFVEYEAFSQSGRWARGEITEQQAREVTPQTARKMLEGLASYVRGGSCFGGVVSVQRGKIPCGT